MGKKCIKSYKQITKKEDKPKELKLLDGKSDKVDYKRK